MDKKIYIGKIIHCLGIEKVKCYENGYVIIENGKITEIGDFGLVQSSDSYSSDATRIILKDSQILIPGLVDSHIHAPQYPNVGLGYDLPLLEWLDKYTYELEKKYSDLEFSKRVYDAVVKKTLSFGTTTACYFASMFKDSSMVLVESALKFGQRAFVGKVNMIKLAPVDYIETAEDSIKHTESFIKDVLAKKSALVQPVITPRFALSCDMDLMKKLSEMAKKYDVNIQTHISENCGEIDKVKEIYGMEYAEVYDEASLLTTKTVLAHGVHLTEKECKLISKRGSTVSHCPSSNTRLQSGQCNVRYLLKNGIDVGLGTDIAGGQSASIIEAMRLSIDNSIHISYNNTTMEPLNYLEAFYLGTLGGATALALEKKIGNFEVGKDFDALVVNMDVANSSADYLKSCTALELLQKFIYVGDDRNVEQVYVAGKLVK